MHTVLLVDDEPSLRRALRRVFEHGGFRVEEAGSAEEALRSCDASSGKAIDAVVSDVLMPDTNGLAFYDQLVNRAPTLADRVVFLTGAAGDPKVLVPVEQRGVPILSKLDDLQLVVDAVRVALLRRR